MLRARFLIPLVIFAAVLVVLGIGLKLDPREVPSPLIDKPAPSFTLPQLQEPDKTISQKDMLGKVWMLNVWASWCVSCREEHGTILELARSGVVPVLGLNYKDERANGMAWLARLGNPYQVSAFDHDGRIGIDYGVYGVPETYVIDKSGVIRYKRIGAVTPEILRDKILPLVKELNARKLKLFGLLLGLIVTASVFAKEAAPASADPVLEKRTMALAEELRCLVCQNQTIADSHAELAIDLKNQIREKLKAGMSEEKIMEYMVARYGDFVLYRPPVKATTVPLWFGPFILLVAALAGLFYYILRRRRSTPVQPLSEMEHARVQALLDSSEERP